MDIKERIQKDLDAARAMAQRYVGVVDYLTAVLADIAKDEALVAKVANDIKAETNESSPNVAS